MTEEISKTTAPDGSHSQNINVSLERDLQKAVAGLRPAAPGPTIEEVERKTKRDAELRVGTPSGLATGVRSQRLSGEGHADARFVGAIRAGGIFPDDLKPDRAQRDWNVLQSGDMTEPASRAVNQSDVTDKMRALYDMAMQLGDRASAIGAAMAGMRTGSEPNQGKPPAHTLFEQQIEALDEIMRIVDNADFELRRVRAVLE